MPKPANPDVFRPIDVPENIKPYVRRALAAETDQIVDMEIDVRATGYHYLGWIWRGRWQGGVNGKINFDSDVDGPFTLTGQVMKNHVTAHMQREVGQIFLEFTALGHFQLLGISGVHNAYDPQILNPKLKAHFEKLTGAAGMTTAARMASMADVLSALPKHPVPNGFAAAVAQMEAVNGNIRISKLTSELGLPERQFRTGFEKLVGLTPKAFCRTLQINQAFNHLLMNNGGDLAGVAARSGFSDQAHFTRAFGEFLGKAPIGYLKDVEATLRRFVGQSRS